MSLSHLDLKPRMVKPRPSLFARAIPPKPGMDFINVKVPLPVLEKIDSIATRLRQSRAATIRHLLVQGLNQDKRQP